MKSQSPTNKFGKVVSAPTLNMNDLALYEDFDWEMQDCQVTTWQAFQTGTQKSSGPLNTQALGHGGTLVAAK
jgi:hypothetical protein